MSTAMLQKAIRDVSERVNEAIYRCEDADMSVRGMREARDLLRVLAHIAGGMDMRKAFGAPGDWGYGNELGQGVLQLLSGRDPAGVDFLEDAPSSAHIPSE